MVKGRGDLSGWQNGVVATSLTDARIDVQHLSNSTLTTQRAVRLKEAHNKVEVRRKRLLA